MELEGLNSIRLFEKNLPTAITAQENTNLHLVLEKTAKRISETCSQGNPEADWTLAQKLVAEWFSLPMHNPGVDLSDEERLKQSIEWKANQLESKDWFEAIDNIANEIVENLA